MRQKPWLWRTGAAPVPYRGRQPWRHRRSGCSIGGYVPRYFIWKGRQQRPVLPWGGVGDLGPARLPSGSVRRSEAASAGAQDDASRVRLPPAAAAPVPAPRRPRPPPSRPLRRRHPVRPGPRPVTPFREPLRGPGPAPRRSRVPRCLRRPAAAGALLRREASACEAALQRDMVPEQRVAARSRTKPTLSCPSWRGCGGRHRSRLGCREGGPSPSPAPRTWTPFPAGGVPGSARWRRGASRIPAAAGGGSGFLQRTLCRAGRCRHRPAPWQVNGFGTDCNNRPGIIGLAFTKEKENSEELLFYFKRHFFKRKKKN